MSSPSPSSGLPPRPALTTLPLPSRKTPIPNLTTLITPTTYAHIIPPPPRPRLYPPRTVVIVCCACGASRPSGIYRCFSCMRFHLKCHHCNLVEFEKQNDGLWYRTGRNYWEKDEWEWEDSAESWVDSDDDAEGGVNGSDELWDQWKVELPQPDGGSDGSERGGRRAMREDEDTAWGEEGGIRGRRVVEEDRRRVEVVVERSETRREVRGEEEEGYETDMDVYRGGAFI